MLFIIRWITSKGIPILEGLFHIKRREIAEILTMLEKEMPTSFFDIQVNLLVHLVDEVKLVGVVLVGGYSLLKDI